MLLGLVIQANKMNKGELFVISFVTTYTIIYVLDFNIIFSISVYNILHRLGFKIKLNLQVKPHESIESVLTKQLLKLRVYKTVLNNNNIIMPIHE